MDGIMLRKLGSTFALALAASALPFTPASAQQVSLEAQFDSKAYCQRALP